jgi:hypothetical protein
LRVPLPIRSLLLFGVRTPMRGVVLVELWLRCRVAGWAAGAVVAAVVLATSAGAASSPYLPAHSHWDGANGDYELKACYDPVARAAGAGSTIGFMPFRAQDAKDYLELDLTTNGYQLRVRRSGNWTVVIPDVKPSRQLSFGVGTEMMIDLVVQGADITLYSLTSSQSRGGKLYHWRTTAYMRGSYIAYYTQPKWSANWDFVHVVPFDKTTVPHDVLKLQQNALDQTGAGLTTFDDPRPVSGGESHLRDRATFGAPQGPDYTYSFTVSGSGTGYVDFRDPFSSSGTFFTAGFYRLKLGDGAPELSRISGGSKIAKTWTGRGGGDGTYTVALHGSSISISGKGSLSVSDSGPQTGIRLRITPGAGQVWSWKGDAH